MIAKYITLFLKFISPILGTAILQAAANELSRLAYPHPSTGRRPAQKIAPQFIDYSRGGAQRTTQNRFGPWTDTFKTETERFHDVLMVAFDVSGPNSAIVHEWLLAQMPEVGKHNAGYVKGEDGLVVNLDSFWLANDERPDNWAGDCDSAVFVSKGNQEEARKILRFHGLVD